MSLGLLVRMWRLYIPIWFYSNRGAILLLTFALLLYIPIWFYSNGYLKILSYWLRLLYIPIWFYSNIASKMYYKPNGTFTFQSGSIQMDAYNLYGVIIVTLHSNLVLFKCGRRLYYLRQFYPLHSNLVLFKSTIRICSPIFQKTLHSNLVLFKSLATLLIKSEIFLYIPIWFYSNDEYFTLGGSQYASLHSNLVLFKYQGLLLNKSIKPLYIPIWFYSNNYQKCKTLHKC